MRSALRYQWMIYDGAWSLQRPCQPWRMLGLNLPQHAPSNTKSSKRIGSPHKASVHQILRSNISTSNDRIMKSMSWETGYEEYGRHDQGCKGLKLCGCTDGNSKELWTKGMWLETHPKMLSSPTISIFSMSQHFSYSIAPRQSSKTTSFSKSRNSPDTLHLMAVTWIQDVHNTKASAEFDPEKNAYIYASNALTASTDNVYNGGGISRITQTSTPRNCTRVSRT